MSGGQSSPSLVSGRRLTVVDPKRASVFISSHLHDGGANEHPRPTPPLCVEAAVEWRAGIVKKSKITSCIQDGPESDGGQKPAEGRDRKRDGERKMEREKEREGATERPR